MGAAMLLSGRRGEAFTRWAMGLIVAVACVTNALKGAVSSVSQDMWPFWALTYRHGFVRRGLAGSLFQLGLGQRSVADQQHVILVAHYVAWVGLYVATVLCSVRLVRRRPPALRLRAAVGATAVVLGHFFPTVGTTAGYLDVYILLIAAGAAWLAWRGRFWAAGGVAAVGPLVHDGFVFLWAPALLCVAREVGPKDRAGVRRRLPLLLPILTAWLALRLHASGALAQSLAEMPERWRGIQVYEMPLRAALERMIDTHQRHYDHVLLALVLYGLPGAIAIATAERRRSAWAWLHATLVLLSPATILLVAWDLSRFLVWTSFSGFLYLCWASRFGANEAETPPRPRWAPAAIVGLSVLAFGGPQLFSYFDRTYPDYPAGPSWLRATPGAHVERAWLALYNREVMIERFSSAARAPCNVDVAGAKLDDACAATLAPGQLLMTPLSLFRPGHYVARVATTAAPDCASGEGVLALSLWWRHARRPPAVHFDAARSTSTTLRFDIDEEESVMGRSRVDVVGMSGCVRVTALEVSRDR